MFENFSNISLTSERALFELKYILSLGEYVDTFLNVCMKWFGSCNFLSKSMHADIEPILYVVLRRSEKLIFILIVPIFL